MAKVKFRQLRNLSEIMKSEELASILDGLGEQVLQAASSDPNPTYVASLDAHRFYSKDRVTAQVGAAPIIGRAVEAKRGTLARALGTAGA